MTLLRALLLTLAAALLVGGCTAVQPLPESVCGTLDRQPVRVPDTDCHPGNTQVRWYYADDDCLDWDDRTDIGQPLNDDYLGEACDPTPHHTSPVIVGVPAPVPTTTKTTPTKTAVPAPTTAAQTRKPTATRTRR